MGEIEGGKRGEGGRGGGQRGGRNSTSRDIVNGTCTCTVYVYHTAVMYAMYMIWDSED